MFRMRGDEWHLVALNVKDPFEFIFEVDATDRLWRIWFLPLGMPIHQPEIQKLVIGTWPYLKEDHYYGVSDLLSIERPLKAVLALEEAIATISSRTASRKALHYFDPAHRNQDEAVKAQSAILDLDNQSVISLEMSHVPKAAGTEIVKKDIIEILDEQIAGDSLSGLNDLYIELKKEINRALGVPDDIGFSTTDAGSYAKSQTEFNVPLARANQSREYIASVINRQVIPDMIKYNYPNLPAEYKLPAFVWGGAEDEMDPVDDEQIRKDYELGLLTLEEAREAKGYGPVPDHTETIADPGESEGDKGFMKKVVAKLLR